LLSRSHRVALSRAEPLQALLAETLGRHPGHLGRLACRSVNISSVCLLYWHREEIGRFARVSVGEEARTWRLVVWKAGRDGGASWCSALCKTSQKDGWMTRSRRKFPLMQRQGKFGRKSKQDKTTKGNSQRGLKRKLVSREKREKSRCWWPMS
jgi:hypothetical protein